MPPKSSGGDEATETLASASGKNVDELLNRVNKRRNAGSGPSIPSLAPGILPPPRRHAAAAPNCGAPAAAPEQEEDASDAVEEIGILDGDDTDTGVATKRQKQARRDGAALPSIASLNEDAADEDDAWEDVEEEDYDPLAALNDDSIFIPGKNAAKSGNGGITVDLGTTGCDDTEAGPSNPRKRTAFTKEDRERARVVHRSHLLCLLGRGLLYDSAANDPLIQAACLSLIPVNIAEQVQGSGGISSVDEVAQRQALNVFVDWFRRQFKLLKSSAAQPPAENESEIDAAISRAKGVSGIVSQLLETLEKRCGTAEELVTLFVASLRALGCVVRLVRLLEPSSLKPGDALRQQENAMKRFSKARKERQRGEKAISLVAQAATDLLYCKESERQEAFKEQIAAQLGLEDISVIKVQRGRGGAPSIQIDGSKLAKSRKKKSQAGGAAGRAGGGGRKQPRMVQGPGGQQQEKQKQQKAQGSGGSRKRKSDADDGDDPEQKKTSAQKKKATAPAVAEKKKGGKLSNAVSEIDLTGLSDSDNPEDALTSPSAATAKKSGNRKKPETAAEGEDKDAVFCQGGVPLDEVKDTTKKKGGKRKRKCDEELERELEVAMAATAFEKALDRKNSEGELESGGGGGNGADPSKSAAGGRSGSTRSAIFGAHQGHVGRYWVEVYCGSTTSGRWVHACPISGWVDRPEDVEGLAPRGQSIAYVVAFGGQGGAKDVTRRYTASFINAEKQREGEWWDSTLRPLRAKEVAALHPAAAGVGSSGGGEVATVTGGAAVAGPSAALAPLAVLPPSKTTKAPVKTSVPMLAAAREDRELEQRAAAEREGLPTTIEGFKSHSVFILARHIGKHQALRPDSKPMGMHRGEAYYLREDVGEVHTAERWRRLGREVLATELSQPAKRLKKRVAGGGGGRGRGRGRGGSAGDDIEEESNDTTDDTAAMSDFFGFWQTKEWAPPKASDGKVPKNDRGNVEVPPFAAALPIGTVHIQLPSIAGVCRKLGIDYAPALVGFEIRGGRSVPSIDGVVVCAEHEAALRAAYEEDVAQRAKQAKQKRMAEAEKAWRELLRALLTRVQLARSYGGGVNGEKEGQQPGSAEGEAAAMLVHDASRSKLQGLKNSGSGPSRAVVIGQKAEQEGAAEEELPSDVKVEEI